MTALRYTGTDGGFLMGVPARDLTDDDLDALAGGRLGKSAKSVRDNLLATGMYATSKPAASTADSKSTKE